MPTPPRPRNSKAEYRPGDHHDGHDQDDHHGLHGHHGAGVAPAADRGRRRVVIEGVTPEVDGGRFPAKRTVGDVVVVEADIFVDGHDALGAVLLFREEGAGPWEEAPMEPLVNDRWRGRFQATALGRYAFTLLAWVDDFASWRKTFAKKVEAVQHAEIDFLTGAALVRAAAARASGEDAGRLHRWATILEDTGEEPRARVAVALGDRLAAAMRRHTDRSLATRYPAELPVRVDRPRARFSAWYEMFPRSCAPEPGQHGTLQDCIDRLPYVAEMGFDVLYLPPIHPIGRTHRKGPNNSERAGAGDPGSPWAIGAPEGGHKAVHPELGDLEAFDRLVRAAREHGLELALDLAYQCAPDHPYVEQHPEWFRKRPDGTIQYAENPPKKYQDIYPIDFESPTWPALWDELKSVVYFWIERGVSTFRVDNPHTKAFPFWADLIDEVTRRHPETIFLSEAFTRPKVMYRLAKLGFSQSYTYFTWRNTKEEITRYLSELTRSGVAEFFRPNLWPNTPDILHEYLQTGGRPAFMARLVLAATLGASYGIYGPAFELCEARPVRPDSEEYRNSEKYQIRHWDRDAPHSLRKLIAQVNRVRRDNPALQRNDSLAFHPTDNPQLICYTKRTADASNIVLVVVNLDPHHVHSGWIDLPLGELGIDPSLPYQAHDLLTDTRFLWHGGQNFVELDPAEVPAHIFRLRRRVRTEHDFDYYM